MKNENIDLEGFVDRLVGEKESFKNLDSEVIAQIKSDLLSRVEDRVNAVIVSNLDEGALVVFNKMLDENKSDEEVQTFLSQNIPDLAQLIASELIVFRQTYLS